MPYYHLKRDLGTHTYLPTIRGYNQHQIHLHYRTVRVWLKKETHRSRILKVDPFSHEPEYDIFETDLSDDAAASN